MGTFYLNSPYGFTHDSLCSNVSFLFQGLLCLIHGVQPASLKFLPMPSCLCLTCFPTVFSATAYDLELFLCGWQHEILQSSCSKKIFQICSPRSHRMLSTGYKSNCLWKLSHSFPIHKIVSLMATTWPAHSSLLRFNLPFISANWLSLFRSLCLLSLRFCHLASP